MVKVSHMAYFAAACSAMDVFNITYLQSTCNQYHEEYLKPKILSSFSSYRYFEKLHHNVESMDLIDSTGPHILDSASKHRF